jgi:hypothetical protein
VAGVGDPDNESEEHLIVMAQMEQPPDLTQSSRNSGLDLKPTANLQMRCSNSDSIFLFCFDDGQARFLADGED